MAGTMAGLNPAAIQRQIRALTRSASHPDHGQGRTSQKAPLPARIQTRIP